MSYATAHSRVLALVKRKGAAVTFTRTTQDYDPETGVKTPSTVTVQGQAAQVEGEPERYQALGLVASQAPTLLFVPATYGDEVDPGDTVSWGGKTWTVRDVEPIAPDGTVIAQSVVVSR